MTVNTGFQVLSLNQPEAQIRAYKKRKFHSKTKDGCLTCKAKRVKCDESRPTCTRCQRNKWQCSYADFDQHRRNFSQLPREASSGSDVSVRSLSTVISAPSYMPSAKYGTLSNTLIHHLDKHWSDVLHMPHSQGIASLSKSHSLVRNTVLAIAACHLRHVSPNIVEHRIAEHFLQYVALQDYQRALDTPYEQLGQSGADALILSGALLSILAFALPHVETTDGGCGQLDPSKSWVFSPHDNRLDWLSLQVGLKPFILSPNPYFKRSLDVVTKIFLGDETAAEDFSRVHPIASHIPSRWVAFFDLEDAGYTALTPTNFADGVQARSRVIAKCNSSNIFYPPVKSLAGLRTLERIDSNIFKNLQLLGKVSREFRALLYVRNEKALWIFGYWLGLMCRYEGIWWCERRVRRDYKAVWVWLDQLHLEERPGAEGEAWKEMMRELEMAPAAGTSS